MNLSKSFLNSIFILMFAVALSACDTKKKLDKMSSTTEKMGETTEKLSEDTTRVADTTVTMSESVKNTEETSETISEQTQMLFKKNREALFVQIQTDQFVTMQNQSAPGKKVDAAVVWVGAMEFQHWDSRFEDQKAREALYLKAVDHFFLKISPLIADDMPVTNYLPSNDWVMLSAIGAAISKVHPDQLDDSIKHNYKAMSLLDILKEGLAAQPVHDAGIKVPEYQRKVLQHKKAVHYILQLRHNFFKALVLGELSNFEEEFFLSANRVWMLMIGWSVTLSDYDQDELSLLNEFLWKALDTQDYIVSLGLTIEHNKAITDVFSKGEIWTDKRPGRMPVALRTSGQLLSLEEAIEVQGQSFFLNLLQNVLRPPAPLVVKSATLDAKALIY